MAREKDAPHRTHFVVVPYFSTLLGGLISNIAFGPIAVVGYLVTGFGDAIGEPVGARFGRHPYRVPCFGLARAERTLEGSAAVFVASVVAVLLGVWLSTNGGITTGAMFFIPAIALASTLAESVSPHGWDNLTMQLVPTMLCHWAFMEVG
jgi:phytol kinase